MLPIIILFYEIVNIYEYHRKLSLRLLKEDNVDHWIGRQNSKYAQATYMAIPMGELLLYIHNIGLSNILIYI